MGVSGFGPDRHINLEEFDRRSRASAQLHRTLPDADDPQALDVDDFRRWWQQSLAQEPAENRFPSYTQTRLAIAAAGAVLVGSALALKGGAPTLKTRPAVVAPANDTSNVSGAMTPVATEAGAHVLGELASRARPQTAAPEPARIGSGRPDGAVSSDSAAVGSPASDAARLSAKPGSEQKDGAIGTPKTSLEPPVQRRGKITASVVVTKTATLSGNVDAPTPPLPIGRLAKPETDPSKAKAFDSQTVGAPPRSVEASKQSLMRALADLFGAHTSPAPFQVDPLTPGLRAGRPTGGRQNRKLRRRGN